MSIYARGSQNTGNWGSEAPLSKNNLLAPLHQACSTQDITQRHKTHVVHHMLMTGRSQHLSACLPALCVDGHAISISPPACLHVGRRDLKVAIDIEPIILGGEDYRAVVHEGHIKALCMLHLGLISRHQLAILREESQVEVVVVVSNEHLALAVDAHTNRVVGDALTPNLSQVLTLIVEHLQEGQLVSGIGYIYCSMYIYI